MAQYNIPKGIPALILKISEKVNLAHPLHDADISGWRMIETTKINTFDIKKRVFGSPSARKALRDKLKCIDVAIFASDDWLICCNSSNAVKG
jgi:hypothetical protein